MRRNFSGREGKQVSSKDETDNFGSIHAEEIPQGHPAEQPPDPVDANEAVSVQAKNSRDESRSFKAPERPELRYDFKWPYSVAKVGLQTAEPGFQGKIEQRVGHNLQTHDLERAMAVLDFPEIVKEIIRLTLEGYTKDEIVVLTANLTTARYKPRKRPFIPGQPAEIIPAGTPYNPSRIGQIQRKYLARLKSYFETNGIRHSVPGTDEEKAVEFPPKRYNQK